jgi:excisionase family DNA binding protein
MHVDRPEPALIMDDRYYTVAEVAKRLGVSSRWLADECRAGRIEHIHIARRRRFTAEQVGALIAKHTVKPRIPPNEDNERLERTRDRVTRRLTRL